MSNKDCRQDICVSPLWDDYELIDSGCFEKLERFGKWVTVRPEPQAVWQKSLPESEWKEVAGAVFRRNTRSDEKGDWTKQGRMPDQWTIKYSYKDMSLRFRLGLTAFKHVGIFPEQAYNWNYIYDRVKEISTDVETPKILNLFAYTGGATLAARSAGASVTHVDSVKQVVTWSNENMELSGLKDVRWMVEDALKFVKREAKRGNKYHGIILDPPAYGRGPDGEKWILEESLRELLDLCNELLCGDKSFIILNLYSMGLSSLVARSTVHSIFDITSPEFREQYGELYFEDKAGRALPLGVYYRFCR